VIRAPCQADQAALIEFHHEHVLNRAIIQSHGS
jgi:hypothetical protein